MAEREEESGREGLLAFLHQLADDIVDRRDVVGVKGVPQPEAVGQKGGREQGRPVRERQDGPYPGSHVRDDQHGVGQGGLGPHPLFAVIERVHEKQRQSPG